ncbi:lactate utilization protein [Clostridium arbusti]|uniref:lactate utilization protein n=1 Tax=Clostridium arbusti TaxID=1137848 RepID=UPI0002889C70|nr:lactate utilization protein [Clostridium arbusti]
MDENSIWLMEQKIKRTIESLEKNNMEGYYAKDEKEVLDIVKKLVNKGESVSVGGSETLFQTGVIDFLRNGDFEFLDRYKPGLTRKEVVAIFKKSFLTDTYLVSSNAITENGELYNVDGNGNRVAAMLYGPDKVIVIVGKNKIVKNLDEAIQRNREYAAPANCKRLDRKTPCTKVGYCMDCKSEERICNEYTLIRRQGTKGRIKVIIVGKELGY